MTSPPDPPAPRRRPDPLLLVLAGVTAGIAVAALRHPRAGMYVVAAALAGGALARLLVRPRSAGSLVVRSRQVDVLVLAALAASVAVLAAVTPLHGTG